MNIPLLANNQSPILVPNGLITYLTFNEQEGNLIYDYSGYWNHGTLNGTYGLIQSNTQRLKHMEFYDTSAYVQTGFFRDFPNSSAGSICLWFKCSAATNNDYVCGNGNWSTDRNGINVALYSSRFYFEVCSAASRASYNPAFTVTGNIWRHGVFTWDTTTIRFYGNGTYFGQAAQSVQYVGNVSPFRVGLDASAAYHLRTGSVDDVRVYNRALTADEVWIIYKGTGG